MAALGVYAMPPSEQDLEEQAVAAGGELVLAAALANALYGASISCGMIAEGQMLEQPIDAARRLSLARSQALKATGAYGPGLVGALHWQAVHIAGPLRALKDDERAPLGQAVAAVSWTLVTLLQAITLAEPTGSTADQVADAVQEAQTELTTAQAHLSRFQGQAATIAAELEGVIAAASRAMRTDDQPGD